VRRKGFQSGDSLTKQKQKIEEQKLKKDEPHLFYKPMARREDRKHVVKKRKEGI